MLKSQIILNDLKRFLILLQVVLSCFYLVIYFFVKFSEVLKFSELIEIEILIRARLDGRVRRTSCLAVVC